MGLFTTPPITYNLNDRGRAASGIARAYKSVPAIVSAINGPRTQEMVKRRDLLGFFSHVPRRMFGLFPLYITKTTENAKIVFIGPCTSKKAEAQKESVKPYIDAVLTFEELQALFDSREIDITTLEEGVLDEASYFGRIFARCGGLAEAVAQGIREHGSTDFELKATSCDGIEQCRIALLKKSKNLLDANFIEGMACTGGCIGGAGCLTHGPRSRAEVDKYGMEANDKTISEALAALDHIPE